MPAPKCAQEDTQGAHRAPPSLLGGGCTDAREQNVVGLPDPAGLVVVVVAGELSLLESQGKGEPTGAVASLRDLLWSFWRVHCWV